MEDNKKWINDIKEIDKLIHYSQIEKRNYYIIKDSFTTCRKK